MTQEIIVADVVAAISGHKVYIQRLKDVGNDPHYLSPTVVDSYRLFKETPLHLVRQSHWWALVSHSGRYTD